MSKSILHLLHIHSVSLVFGFGESKEIYDKKKYFDMFKRF